jgi:hypothetical protein
MISGDLASRTSRLGSLGARSSGASIDNRPVRDPEEVAAALSGRGPITALTLIRDGREYFLVVPG